VPDDPLTAETTMFFVGLLLPPAAIVLLVILVVRAKRRKNAVARPLPPSEWAALDAAKQRTVQLAAAGRVEDGYVCLVRELNAVRGPEDTLAWQSALEDYRRVFRFTPRSEMIPATATRGRGNEPAAGS
jgi:hypothetical protein